MVLAARPVLSYDHASAQQMCPHIRSAAASAPPCTRGCNGVPGCAAGSLRSIWRIPFALHVCRFRSDICHAEGRARNPVYPTDIPRTSRWHCGPPVLNAASSAVFLLVIIWLKDSLLISNLPKRLFNYLSTLQSRHILPEKESLQFALYNLVVSYDQGVRRLSAK